MPVECFAFQKRLVRIEGTREEIDRGMEKLNVGDEISDIEETFESEGCHVRTFP